MPDLKITLENALLALQQDIAPAVVSDKAKGSVRAIGQILARLIANAGTAEAGVSRVDLIETLEAGFGGSLAHAQASRLALEQQELAGRISAADELIEWEAEVLGRLGAEAGRLLAGAPPGNEETAYQTDIRAALETYLRSRFGEQARLTGFRDLFGGRSKFTSLVTIEGAPGVTGEFALRRDATMNLTGGRSVIEEHPILKVLHANGAKVPRPALAEPDASVLGAPFILVERLIGACGEIYATPPSVALLKDAAGVLARFHRVPLAAYAEAGVALLSRQRADVAADIDGIERAWIEGGGPTSVAMPLAFRWLRANLDRAFQGEPSLAHCDVRFHNILFEGDAVTGLLDWELARASYPAEDLGYFRPTVTAMMPWEDFMTAYVAAGGPIVAEDQIDFYSIFTATRMASLSAGVNRAILGRQTRDIQLTAVPLHDIYIWISELAQHLRRVAKYS